MQRYRGSNQEKTDNPRKNFHFHVRFLGEFGCYITIWPSCNNSGAMLSLRFSILFLLISIFRCSFTVARLMQAPFLAEPDDSVTIKVAVPAVIEEIFFSLSFSFSGIKMI